MEKCFDNVSDYIVRLGVVVLAFGRVRRRDIFLREHALIYWVAEGDLATSWRQLLYADAVWRFPATSWHSSGTWKSTDFSLAQRRHFPPNASCPNRGRAPRRLRGL